MLPIAAIIGGVLIGGILYRLRGGVLKDLWPRIFGTELSRLAWAIPTACLMTETIHAPWWFAAPLSLTNFAALAMFGTGQYLQDVPLRKTPDWLGLARNSLAAIPTVLYGWPLFILYALSGATHAILYWLGHRTSYGSKAGEFFVGAVSWAVIIGSALL